MAVEINKSDTLRQALEKIEKEINNRRTYGVRREELPTTKQVTACIWSNANAAWFCGRPQTGRVCPNASREIQEILRGYDERRNKCWSPRTQVELDEMLKRGDEEGKVFEREKPDCHEVVSKVQCLDANEIVITGMERRQVQALAPLFNQLPLYAGSFEARGRGKFGLLGIEIPPPIANKTLDELDPQTIAALVEKSLVESGGLED